MKLILLLPAIAAALSTRFPIPRRSPPVCGTANPPLALRQQAQKFMHELATPSLFATMISNITVNVYMHVITETAKQKPRRSSLKKQIAVLESIYGPLGINFHHVNTSYTINETWATGDRDIVTKRMVPALRTGSYWDLNLYFSSGFAYNYDPPWVLLGMCHLPYVRGLTPDIPVQQDGCVIALDTLPDTNVTDPGWQRYTHGRTAVHEVGHWFGLFHVFQNDPYRLSQQDLSPPVACQNDDGDLIADTPPQFWPSHGCPEGKDTCPGDGVDSIHNYMDYSDDDCMTEFTPGQISRMHEMFHLYRTGHVMSSSP